MAKVKGPILSLSARGSIAKSQVYSSWRGVAYARQHVTPANPRTAEQMKTRNVFAALDEQWKRMGQLSREPWKAEVERRPLTPRNAIFRTNLPPLRGQADMSGWIGSPGAKSGLPPVSVTAAGGASAGELAITVKAPKEPTGWTLAAVVVHAVQDRDPAVIPTEFVVEAEDLAPTVDGDTVVTLTGLTSAQLYAPSGWLKWTRPDGQTAYGASRTAALTAAT